MASSLLLQTFGVSLIGFKIIKNNLHKHGRSFWTLTWTRWHIGNTWKCYLTLPTSRVVKRTTLTLTRKIPRLPWSRKRKKSWRGVGFQKVEKFYFNKFFCWHLHDYFLYFLNIHLGLIQSNGCIGFKLLISLVGARDCSLFIRDSNPNNFYLNLFFMGCVFSAALSPK